MAGLELPDLISSIFNANAKPGQPMSLEALQSRRRIAEAIMAGRRKDPYPKNLGEGLTYLGESIADKAQLDRLDEEDQKLAALQPGKRDAATGPLPGTAIAPPQPVVTPPPPPPPQPVVTSAPPPPAAVRPAPTPTVGPGFPEVAGGNAPAGFRPEPGLNAGNLMDSIQFRSDQGDPPLGMQPQPPAPESPTFPPPDSQLNRRRAPGPQTGLDPRSAVAQALLAQRGAIPPGPTEAATPAGSPPVTTAALGGAPDVATDAPAPEATRLAQAPSFADRFGDTANPPTVTDIRPMPGYDPAKEPIRQPRNLPFPDIGPEARRPPLLPQSDTELRLRALMVDPHATTQTRVWAEQQLKLHEAYREKQQAQQQEDYTHERGKRDELVKAQREYNLGEDKRVMDYHISALDAKIKQATIANQPVEAEKLSYERDKLRQEAAAGQLRIVGDNLLSFDERSKKWVDVTPAKAAEDITLPEGDKKEIKFFTRAIGARHQFGDLTSLTRYVDVRTGQLPDALWGNYLVSDQYRMDRSAAYTWVAAVLRDESGALIGKKEQDDKFREYFPQPGDKLADIENKARRRAVEEYSFYAGLTGKARPAADKVIEDFNKYSYERNAEKPAIKFTDPADIARRVRSGELQQGRRIEMPDGTLRPVARKTGLH
jgi:hypothetical protein